MKAILRNVTEESRQGRKTAPVNSVPAAYRNRWRKGEGEGVEEIKYPEGEGEGGRESMEAEAGRG